MTDPLATRLNELLSRRRRNQSWLAERLGYTQGHVSKVLRGNVPISKQFRAKAERLAGKFRTAPDADKLLSAVETAARDSKDFKEAILAILRLMHENA